MSIKSIKRNAGMPIKIDVGDAQLKGDLAIPEFATGLVLFAHGSGSSRLSPRNQSVSETLNTAGLATLLIDLLTPEEAEFDLDTKKLRFDIEFLGNRLVKLIDWLAVAPETEGLKLGIFGASTGAAAAIVAAARREKWVEAVVSRGGRPDLSGNSLQNLQAPTLLIVGGDDPEVLRLNQEAMKSITCSKEIAIISGASHLFEEPGTLEQVAVLAKDCFVKHLS